MFSTVENTNASAAVTRTDAKAIILPVLIRYTRAEDFMYRGGDGLFYWFSAAGAVHGPFDTRNEAINDYLVKTEVAHYRDIERVLRGS